MTVHNIDTKVALLESDVRVVAASNAKYEAAIEKIAEVSQSMKELLTVHQLKLDELEKNGKKLQDYLDRDNHVMHKRITDLTDKVKQDMDEQYNELMSIMKETRAEQKALLTELNLNMTKVVSDLERDHEEQIKRTDSKFSDFDKRLRIIERWRWLLIGGGMAIGAASGYALRLIGAA